MLADPPENASAEAIAACARAADLVGERRFADAIADAELAARLEPGWTAPWVLLAIGYKHDLRFRECLESCARGRRGQDELDAGVNWNAGIAATALGEWVQARAAWAACGIAVPSGEGPLDMALGLVPVRLQPDGAAEVVWCARLDPCRARIRSVPLPDSRRRFGDLLLHDGERRGERTLGGVVVPVFDELTLLEPSDMGTWVMDVDVADPAALETLLAPLEGAEHEDWTENVRDLCAACSLGTAHEHDEHQPEGGWQRRRSIGVAAPSEATFKPLRGLLGRWRRGVRSVKRAL